MGREAVTRLELSGVGHAYLGRTVLDQVHLAVGVAEIVALVGPSGCGKSTLLHIAAGLMDPVRGRVIRNYRRHGVVFQEPRLLPWATARDNIAIALRRRGVDGRTRRRRVREVAASVALGEDDLNKYPLELSGGMAQRVAVARALAAEPDFVFLDELFSALDVGLKRRLQDLTIAALDEGGVSALFVTHDLAEAARIAHRIVVLDGRGQGVIANRRLPDRPGRRSERQIFDTVQDLLTHDPAFLHINDVGERD